jgi:hypothetical protein
MSKTIIAPLIGFIALIAGALFHVPIGEATQAQIVEFISQGIALVLVLDGIFRNHKKE